MSTVGLLRVGHIDPSSRHVCGDYVDLYRALLEPHCITVREFHCDEGDLPASLADCDGWLCSPSRSSTYDELPWLAEVEALLSRILAEERPFVGICFGHQLLARTLGAEVGRAEHGWSVGVQPYDVVAAPPWADPWRERICLIASHQDQVMSVPDGATLLAGSEACPVAGLLVGERAWTLQGHPEFTWELADSLLAGRVELLGADLVARARASLAQPADQQLIGTWMARFFNGCVP